jgi:hypothetical protein
MWFAALRAVSDLYCVKSFPLTLLFLELCLGRHVETLEIFLFFQEVLVFATATAGSSEVTFRDDRREGSKYRWISVLVSAKSVEVDGVYGYPLFVSGVSNGRVGSGYDFVADS